jgi:hypothetical protein
MGGGGGDGGGAAGQAKTVAGTSHRPRLANTQSSLLYHDSGVSPVLL